MGSTITAQPLKVAINETITLGGVVRNGSTSVNIGSVGAIISGITTVANKASTENNTILAAFGNAAAAETAVAILPTAVKYVRVTNLDDTNSIYYPTKFSPVYTEDPETTPPRLKVFPAITGEANIFPFFDI